MYAALWHALPGPWPVRLVILLALVAGVAYLMIVHVYPWIMQSFFPTPDPVLSALGRAVVHPSSQDPA